MLCHKKETSLHSGHPIVGDHLRCRCNDCTVSGLHGVWSLQGGQEWGRWAQEAVEWHLLHHLRLRFSRPNHRLLGPLYIQMHKSLLPYCLRSMLAANLDRHFHLRMRCRLVLQCQPCNYPTVLRKWWLWLNLHQVGKRSSRVVRPGNWWSCQWSHVLERMPLPKCSQ